MRRWRLETVRDGAGVCLLIMVLGLPEGPGQLFTLAAAEQKFSLGSFGSSLADRVFPYFIGVEKHCHGGISGNW